MARSALDEAYAAKMNESMANDPRNWPVNQEMKARGGFNPPPTTINVPAIWEKAKSIAGKIQSGFQSLGQRDLVSPVPTPTPQSNIIGNPSQIKTIYGKASPTPTPTPTLISANPNQFKFQMGLKDYSFTRPQLTRLFTEKQSSLLPYVDEFITAGETSGVDPRILPAIAQGESSLGKNYPTESFNPFGYIVFTDPNTGQQRSPQNYEEIIQGLYGAGFQSFPHAVQALTGRFARQPTQGYQQFYQDPTISNLQLAYNANAGERENYLRLLNEIIPYFQ